LFERITSKLNKLSTDDVFGLIDVNNWKGRLKLIHNLSDELVYSFDPDKKEKPDDYYKARYLRKPAKYEKANKTGQENKYVNPFDAEEGDESKLEFIRSKVREKYLAKKYLKMARFLDIDIESNYNDNEIFHIMQLFRQHESDIFYFSPC
jgi:hypothetical protein